MSAPWTPETAAAYALLARYRVALAEFDRRPAKYRPRLAITPIGEALLLHRAIDDLNTAEQRHGGAK